MSHFLKGDLFIARLFAGTPRTHQTEGYLCGVHLPGSYPPSSSWGCPPWGLWYIGPYRCDSNMLPIDFHHPIYIISILVKATTLLLSEHLSTKRRNRYNGGTATRFVLLYPAISKAMSNFDVYNVWRGYSMFLQRAEERIKATAL